VSAGRLLLVRRAHDPWRGSWDLPGGFCAVDEHPSETAVREVLEETGLAIEITGLLGVWRDDYPSVRSSEPTEVTLNLYYHAVPLAGSAVPADPAEVSEVGWFRPVELPRELAFPGHIPRVLDAWREAVRCGRVMTPLPDRPRRRSD